MIPSLFAVFNNFNGAKGTLYSVPFAFPDIVDNYVNYGKKYTLAGGDGKNRTLIQLRGSLNGQAGIFEWIVNPDKSKGKAVSII